MDPRLLRHYNRELQLLREMGGEFAEEFPKIAGRLGLERLDCTDPYVERLLEGFGFLAARVQLKIESEFPRFTQHLLENVYPDYLAPCPSMAVARFEPDLTEGALSAGFEIERGSQIRSRLGRRDATPCEYRTAHPVTLWPLEIASVEYVPQARAMARIPGPADFQRTRAALRLRLRCTAGLTFDQLSLDSLPIYLAGSGDVPSHLYEQLLGQSLGVAVGPSKPRGEWTEAIPRSCIRPMGFDDDHALLPVGPRSFQGYRLLQEYFGFPQRFFFVEIAGLAAACRRCTDSEMDVTVLLEHSDPVLENAVELRHLSLFCSPIVNLFEKRADRINMSDRSHELHVVADRTRPMDYELHSIQSVTGFGSGRREQPFMPLYCVRDRMADPQSQAFYTVRREPRRISSRQRLRGQRSSYVGSETFLALVDPTEAPYAGDLREVGVTALCTNRDLPLHIPVGRGSTDFTLDTGAPVESIRCMAGPTKPTPTSAEGESAWRLISHLSLNYLSLVDQDDEEGAAALRSLLTVYANPEDAEIARRIEGILSITSKPIARRILDGGPVSFQRGLELTLRTDESAFEGTGAFLAGAVLAAFFARYVSINSFTETVLTTTNRGEVMRWPASPGRRLTI